MDRKGLVFDFDGTICRLFKNYNLNQVVLKHHNKMKEYGLDFPLDKDAFDIFEFIRSQKDLRDELKLKLLEEANDALTLAEVEAVKSCELVNGVAEIIPELKKAGYILGVATNNSPQCVAEFFRLYCSEIDSLPIVGRVGRNPELMKPNPWSLVEVLKKMGCSVGESLFIGDTRRDYDCSMNANCKFIGMAPTELKLQRLRSIQPSIEIVSDYYELREKI